MENTFTTWTSLPVAHYREHAKNILASDASTVRSERGLAYWACTYHPLPGNPDRHGRLGVDEALRHLPRVDPAKQKRPLGAALNDLPGFTSAVESIAAATDAEDAISRHTAAFARVLIAHPEVPPIPLVHTITAPTAMQNLLPYMPRELGIRFYGYLWQVSAAIAAIFATPMKPDAETDPRIGEPMLRRTSLFVVRSSMATSIRSSCGGVPARR